MHLNTSDFLNFVKTSLVQNKSFIAIGIPSNGLAVLFEILLSDSSADLMAFSQFSEIYAFRSLFASASLR